MNRTGILLMTFFLIFNITSCLVNFGLFLDDGGLFNLGVAIFNGLAGGFNAYVRNDMLRAS